MGSGWLCGAIGQLGTRTAVTRGTEFDAVTLLTTGGPTRAILVITAVLVLGVGLRWWDGGIFDRAIDAAATRPVTAFAYGLAAHAAIAFAGFYLTAKLGRLSFGGYFVGWLGVLFGVGLLFVTAAIGFGVIGTVVVGVVSDTARPAGIAVGALIAGGLTLLEPLVGTVTWLVLVSAGIGGFVRAWATDSFETSNG